MLQSQSLPRVNAFNTFGEFTLSSHSGLDQTDSLDFVTSNSVNLNFNQAEFKILIVNDEPFQLLAIQNIVQHLNKEVFIKTALNGDLAVREIQKNMLEFF